MRIIIAFRNRLLQVLALYIPGVSTTRVFLHRLRGVKIGTHVFIGTAAILETEHPERISIGNNICIGVRTVILAHTGYQTHFAKKYTVVIEDNIFMGPGVIILPNVTIGTGSVIAAGSVIKRSIPPYSFVEGNPAKIVAKCGIPYAPDTSYFDFISHLKPL